MQNTSLAKEMTKYAVLLEKKLRRDICVSTVILKLGFN